MESLPLPDYHINLPTTATVQPAKDPVREQAVEIISDDEDERNNDGQPESSTRVSQLSPTVKRAVTIDSDDDEVDVYHAPHDWPIEHTRMKRRKHDHTDTSDQFTALVDPSDFMDLTTAGTLPLATNDNLFRSAEATDLSFDLDARQDPIPLVLQPVAGPQTVDAMPQTADPKQIDKSDNIIDNEKDKGKGKTKQNVAPFYDDVKLGVRMYCGPGYERFPVVLGTVDEHQDICDKWTMMEARKTAYRKSRRACRAELARYVGDALDASDSDDDQTDVPEDILMEMDLLHRLREVFPDMQRKFAVDRIRAHIQACYVGGDEEIRIQPNVTDIVSQILEGPDYPRQEKVKKICEPAADGTGVTVSWRKGDPENKTYHRDAVCLLAGHFDHIPTHFIYKIVQEKQSLFEAYLYIYGLDHGYDATPSKERLYRRYTNPRTVLEKKYTTKDTGSRSTEQWKNTVNELQAARQQAERNTLLRQQELERQALEDANLQEHKASGDIIECQCCFDEEIPANRAVSCLNEELHWFCFACVLRLAENQVGSMKHEMTCMHQSGCKADLASAGIKCAVPTRLYEKLEFYQQQSEITAANIEGLEQCPFCDFKAICDPPELTSVFQCQNPDCRRISCRKCHEDSHLPKSCEEVSVDRRLSARHQVEEARSAAMMRACPKCQVKIIKEIGCNKMRCSKCGCVMCYVCKMDISSRRDGGYGHFNDSGAKCVLYDKDFDRHEAEADEAEREAIKKVQEENIDIDEKQLQIGTGTKKINPAPPKDELGFGWGQGLFPARNARRQEAFEAAMRQHRERYDEVYRRILNQREQQQAHLNRIAAATNNAHLQAVLPGQAYQQVHGGGLIDEMAAFNHPLLKAQVPTTPQVPFLPPAPLYNHPAMPQQVNFLAVQPGNFRGPNVALAPEMRQQQPAPAPEQGGLGRMFGGYLDPGNRYLTGSMNHLHNGGNPRATASQLAINPMTNLAPLPQGGNDHRQPLPVIGYDNMAQGQRQPQPMQQPLHQQQHLANDAVMVNNFLPYWNTPRINLDMHDFGNNEFDWQMLNQEEQWDTVDGAHDQLGMDFQADPVRQGPAQNNVLQPNPGVFF